MVKAAVRANPRVAAAILLKRLADGRSVSDLLLDGLDDVAPRDRALVKEFCFGVARWRPRLQAIADLLLSRPIKAKEGEVRALIQLGLYQLIYMRVGAHAAVAETVEAARLLNKKWAVGLINAVLRRFQREQEALEAQADEADEARYACPTWLLKRLQVAWPEKWQSLIEAANCHPPMSLRLNLSRVSAESYSKGLEQVGCKTEGVPGVPSALVLDRAMDVDVLPGFAEGEVSLQDAGAQLAVSLLDLKPGLQVLDACAAPGGKSCHILELAPVKLTALDIDEKRLQRVEQNLQRLKLTAVLAQGDAAQPEGEWANQRYDRILLDVPCSATGVIRRHPDIKLLRRESDIQALAKTQATILDAIWPLLNPGGRLVYATCSLLPEENELQVARFLSQRQDAREWVVDAAWGHARVHGRQTLPGELTMDGFYYACLEKV